MSEPQESHIDPRSFQESQGDGGQFEAARGPRLGSRHRRAKTIPESPSLDHHAYPGRDGGRRGGGGYRKALYS